MIYPAALRTKFFYIPLLLVSIIASLYLLGVLFTFLGNFSWLFTIILVAWFISIALDPFVELLCKRRVHRALAIIFSFVLVFFILFLIGVLVMPSLYNELNLVASQVSTIDLNKEVNDILNNLHLSPVNITNTIPTHLDQVINFLLSNSVALLQNIFSIFLGLILSFFFAFYILYQGRKWKKDLLKLIPEKYRKDFELITYAVHEGIEGFFKGQTIIAAIVAIATIICMRLLGLNLIIVAGLYVFIAMYLPMIGPPIAFIVPILIAASTSFTAGIVLFIYMFALVQVVVNILQPKIFSKSLGLHPVIVVMSVLVGGQLFGLIGAFLALPAASIIQSLLVHYYKRQ